MDSACRRAAWQMGRVAQWRRGVSFRMMQPHSRPPRERVDLRTLPVWLQYTISLVIVALVLGIVLLSWQSGSGPDPVWLEFINRFVVPIAGWLGLAAFAFLLIRRLRRRR